ncbi:MAG: DUF4381 domain-containing protein [Thiolinea sp.]
MNSGLQLRDIHVPADVGWWPPAYGWWLLFLLCLLLVFILLRHWRRKKARPFIPQVCQPALQELQRLEKAHADNPGQLIRELSVLLRRSAISLYGRHQVSGLSGSHWLEFLDQQQQGNGKVFSERFRKMLTELPYREHSDASAGDLVSAVRKWLLHQQDKRNAAGENHV